MKDTNIFAQYALRIHALGFGVIPLAEGNKSPHMGLLPKGQNNKPEWGRYELFRVSRKQMEIWAERCPSANYGIVCGYPSRPWSRLKSRAYLYVLDVDDHEQFCRMRHEFEEHNVSCPVVRSGNGGHFYLSSSRLIKTGDITYNGMDLEIKGQGSYVVGPGCIHPDTGAIYESNDFDIDTQTPVPILDEPWFAPNGLETIPFPKPISISARKILAERAAHYHRVQLKSIAPDYSKALQSTALAAWNRSELQPDERRSLFREIMLEADFVNHLEKYRVANNWHMVEHVLDLAWKNVLKEDSLQCKLWLSWTERVIPMINRGELSLLTSRAEPSERMVLLAHLKASTKRKGPIYHLDSRSGAVLAQCSRRTFTKYTWELIQMGLIKKVRKGSGKGDTSIYEICKEKIEGALCTLVAIESSDEMGGVGTDGYTFLESNPSPRSGSLRVHGANERNLQEVMNTSGAFERGALGPTGLKIYSYLIEQEEMSATALATTLRMNKKTLDTNLGKLTKAGLIDRVRPGTYRAVCPKNIDFDAVAENLGTEGKRQKREELHARERLDDFYRRKDYRLRMDAKEARAEQQIMEEDEES